MKCRYCNKELPRIINGGRDVCECDKAQKEWSIEMKIQLSKRQLAQYHRELSDLRDTKEVKGEQ